MWDDLLAATALFFVFEGILPFLSPDGFKKSLEMMGKMDNRSIRYTGMFSMLAGLGLLYMVR